jgi:hypothetical protein
MRSGGGCFSWRAPAGWQHVDQQMRVHAQYAELSSSLCPPPALHAGAVRDRLPRPCMQVQYVTIAGKFIKGASLGSDKGLLAKFAGAGYQQVGGWVGWGVGGLLTCMYSAVTVSGGTACTSCF